MSNQLKIDCLSCCYADQVCTTCAPSSGGVNGGQREDPLAERTRNPLEDKGKSTLCEQDASRPRAGEGRGANASDGGVFGGVNALLELVRENPGLRANALADLSGKGRRTVERYLGALVLLKQVGFRGAPRNGGYYPIGSKGGPHG